MPIECPVFYLLSMLQYFVTTGFVIWYGTVLELKKTVASAVKIASSSTTASSVICHPYPSITSRGPVSVNLLIMPLTAFLYNGVFFLNFSSLYTP